MKKYKFNVKYYVTTPNQIIVRFDCCTFLLFNSGQSRFMGKAELEKAQHYLNVIIKCIHSHIINPLVLVSQTIIFQLQPSLCPVNLLLLCNHINQHSKVNFECEIFPALVLHFWKPIHVNVFANGKVIVLGKDSLKVVKEISDWLFFNICLLPI